MLVLFCLISILILPFKSKSRLEAENIALRHQVMVLRRSLADMRTAQTDVRSTPNSDSQLRFSSCLL